MHLPPVSAAAEIYQIPHSQIVPSTVISCLKLCLEGLQKDTADHPELQSVILETEKQIRGVMNGTVAPDKVSMTELILALGQSAIDKSNLPMTEFVDKEQKPLDPDFRPFKTDSLLDACNEILTKAQGKTLVLWDIDYVVFRSQTHFGSVEWSKEIYAELKNAGFSAEASENILNVIWRYIQPDTPIEPCDQSLHEVVQNLDKQGIVQHGKTARPPEDATYTLKQLEQIGFFIPKKSIHRDSAHHLKSDTLKGIYLPMCVKNGIAFVNSFTSKGTAADQLPLNEYDCIVIIEDSASNITKVATSVLSAGKKCIGILYTGAMVKRKYEPLIARLQMQHYPKILTNEEALERIAGGIPQVLEGESIRPHLRELGEIHDTIYSEWPYFVEPGTCGNPLKHYEDFITTPDGVVIVAKENDKIVGFIAGKRLDKGHPRYKTAFENQELPENAFHVRDLLVKPEYRTQGVATRLYEAFEKYVKSKKYAYITAAVTERLDDTRFTPYKPEDTLPTHTLWTKKLGFTHVKPGKYTTDWQLSVSVGNAKDKVPNPKEFLQKAL